MPSNSSLLFLFGPQARLPPAEPLEELLKVLSNHNTLQQKLLWAIDGLPTLFKKLQAFDSSLHVVPAVESLTLLSKWLTSGHLTGFTQDLPNVVCLPLTVLLQTALYIQHLDQKYDGDISQTIQPLQQHGVQGFCIGFLTATTIAFSGNEEQLCEHVTTSINLAMCLGAYIDQNAVYAQPSNPACVFSVRWKSGDVSIGQVEEILGQHPNVRTPVSTKQYMASF